MNNSDLSADYLKRAKGRLKALETLYGEQLWADVVRESQEVVELALKGLLRFLNIDVPRIHDVGAVLEAQQDRISQEMRKQISEVVDISRELRRDRELAFYGSEDITPLQFYKQKHAKTAIEGANRVVAFCFDVIARS